LKQSAPTPASERLISAEQKPAKAIHRRLRAPNEKAAGIVALRPPGSKYLDAKM
jgi:hypothetical protein